MMWNRHLAAFYAARASWPTLIVRTAWHPKIQVLVENPFFRLRGNIQSHAGPDFKSPCNSDVPSSLLNTTLLRQPTGFQQGSLARHVPRQVVQIQLRPSTC